MDPSASVVPSPLPARRERIASLDVTRGVAIFGILVVNVIGAFGGPYPTYGREPWTDPLSQTLMVVGDFAFASKFFPLFSLLFGVGLGLQSESMEAAGLSPRRFVLRRLLVLLLIGLVHLVLVSTIDILVPYALLGALTLWFRKLAPRRLLWIAGVCLCVPVVLTLAHNYDTLFGAEPHMDWGPSAADLITAYQSSSLRAIYTMRAVEIAGYYVWMLFYCGWVVTAMIALGTLAVRTGWIGDGEDARAKRARLLPWAFALGVPAALFHALFWSWTHLWGARPGWAPLASSVAGAIGEPCMAVGYACALSIWTPRMPSWLSRSLSNVGRTALSNYVLQSVVMFFVFMGGVGLGQYGVHSPVWYACFVIVVYVGQVVASEWWLRRHAMGPLERLWRTWTDRLMGSEQTDRARSAPGAAGTPP